MDLTGKIIAELPERSGVSNSTGKPWKVKSYVIETLDTQYPRRMCFEVFGEDKINSLGITSGRILKVYFDIDARQYKDNWYNTIRAWKVEEPQGVQPTPPTQAVSPVQPQQQAANPAQPLPQATYNGASTTPDELPF